jgi:hypothetical protein
VAGWAALIRSERFALSADQIAQALSVTAQDVADPAGMLRQGGGSTPVRS